MIEARWYQPEDSARWDAFVAASDNGTFLHSRRYLSYHDAGRIRDRSVLITRKGNILAALPACDFPSTKDCVLRSHGGLTYGGLLLSSSASYEDVAASFKHIRGLAMESGYHSLLYKAVPAPFQSRVRQEDHHILWNMGAQVARRDIASVVSLGDWTEAFMTSGRRQNARKFQQTGSTIEVDSTRWPDYWNVLEEVLRQRHDAHPTHSLDEILKLKSACPENISLNVVLQNDRVVAGVVEYRQGSWIHTQYIAANAAGREAYALDGLLVCRLRQAQREGLRAYSFGASVESEGRVVNTGLLRFKESLGATGVIFESMLLSLE